MIAQQSTHNVISELNEWSHSWEIGKQRKPRKKTINNGDSETTRCAGS